MKRVYIAAALAFVMLLCGCSQTVLDTPAGMQLASAEETDYYLYLPDTWIISGKTGISSAYASITDASNISCCKYIITDSEQRRIVFMLSETETTADKTEVADGIVYAKRYWSIYEQELKQAIPGYTQVGEPLNVDLDGCAAVRYTYISVLSGVSYKHSMVVCCPSASASCVYLLTYTATAENYDTNAEFFSQAIQYFKFQTGILE